MVDHNKSRTNSLFLAFSWSSFESDSLWEVSLGETFVTQSLSSMGMTSSLAKGGRNIKDESKGSESRLDEGMKVEAPPTPRDFLSVR